jgi:dTDP-4-dehydrorhamnose reductase
VQVNAISSKQLPREALRPAWSVLDTAKYLKETGRDIRSWDSALNDYLMVVGYAGRGNNL